LHYNLACLEAIEGNRDESLAALRGAFAVLRQEARSELAASARDDEDFESLHDDPEFVAITAGQSIGVHQQLLIAPDLSR
jgi:hypothetical protein